MEISGLIAIFAAIIVSRILNERGYRRLNDEEKLRLMDGFSKTRAYSMIPLIVLVGAYYFLMTKTDMDKRTLSIGYFGLLSAFVTIRTLMNQRKLTEMNLSAVYRRYFMISQIVSLVGAAWFFYTIFAKKLGA